MRYLFIFGLFLFACSSSSTYSPTIKGVTLEGPSSEISFEKYEQVDSLSPNYVALIPFAYLSSNRSSNLLLFPDWQWWGEDTLGIIATIKMAKRSQHKVMIKPQLWIQPAFFTGDYNCKSDHEWRNFETGYRAYILTYARISQKEGVEILCLGNELKSFISQRPKFWDQLIEDVKSVYHGKLTYAANWDNYEKIPFWDQLDYIGINGYFPLIEEPTPSISELNHAWIEIKKNIKYLSQNKGKKVIFTEYGYRSIEGTTGRPWESYTNAKFSSTAQEKAYQSFYDTFWEEEFVEGGFMWKWRINGSITSTDKSYSVFGKSTNGVIKKCYSK